MLCGHKIKIKLKSHILLSKKMGTKRYYFFNKMIINKLYNFITNIADMWQFNTVIRGVMVKSESLLLLQKKIVMTDFVKKNLSKISFIV